MAEIQRLILDKLKAWKENPHRKPLVLQGARQVGKSWALKKFGRESFEDMVYINFDTMPAMKEDFKRTKEPLKLIKSMELMTGKNTKICMAEYKNDAGMIGAFYHFRAMQKKRK